MAHQERRAPEFLAEQVGFDLEHGHEGSQVAAGATAPPRRLRRSQCISDRDGTTKLPGALPVAPTRSTSGRRWSHRRLIMKWSGAAQESIHRPEARRVET